MGTRTSELVNGIHKVITALGGEDGVDEIAAAEMKAADRECLLEAFRLALDCQFPGKKPDGKKVRGRVKSLSKRLGCSEAEASHILKRLPKMDREKQNDYARRLGIDPKTLEADRDMVILRVMRCMFQELAKIPDIQREWTFRLSPTDSDLQSIRDWSEDLPILTLDELDAPSVQAGLRSFVEGKLQDGRPSASKVDSLAAKTRHWLAIKDCSKYQLGVIIWLLIGARGPSANGKEPDSQSAKYHGHLRKSLEGSGSILKDSPDDLLREFSTFTDPDVIVLFRNYEDVRATLLQPIVAIDRQRDLDRMIPLALLEQLAKRWEQVEEQWKKVSTARMPLCRTWYFKLGTELVLCAHFPSRVVAKADSPELAYRLLKYCEEFVLGWRDGKNPSEREDYEHFSLIRDLIRSELGPASPELLQYLCLWGMEYGIRFCEPELWANVATDEKIISAFAAW